MLQYDRASSLKLFQVATMLRIRLFLSANILIAIALALPGCATPAKETLNGGDRKPPLASPQPDTKSADASGKTAFQLSLPSQKIEKKISLSDLLTGKGSTADSLSITFVGHRRERYGALSQQSLSHGEMEAADDLGIFTLNAWKDCAGRLDRLFTGYDKFYQTMRERRISDGETDAGLLLAEDITFMENNCEEILKNGLPRPGGRIGGQPALQLEGLVRRLMENLRYQDAVAAYDQLTRDFPDHPVSTATSKQYGMALLMTGQLREAITHFEETGSKQQTTAEEIWDRERFLGDLYFAAEQFDKARQKYENLENYLKSLTVEIDHGRQQLTFLDTHGLSAFEKKGYSSLVLDFLSLDNMTEAVRLLDQTDRFKLAFPNSQAAEQVRKIKSITEGRLRLWAGKQLQQVDQFIDDEKFEEALAALEEMSPDSLPVGLYEIVQNSVDEVLMARAGKEEIGRQEYERFLADRWTAAVNILDSKQYDLAIAAFTSLLHTDYETESRAKIANAAKQAATEKRKEAATLFIKAGKTTDQEQKIELLLASRALLQEIINKYPQVDIIDKAFQNLKIIDEQIRLIGPDLLDTTKTDQQSTTAIGYLPL